MSDLVALDVQTPTANGAQSFEQGASAASDLNSAHLQQANASIQMIGSVALGAMNGNINGQADPAKWQQGMALLKAHGIPTDGLTPESAPVIARASVSTLGQLSQAQNQQELTLRLQEFANTLQQQRTDNAFKANAANYAEHEQLQPNSMFGMTTPDALRAQSGLPPTPMLGADGQPMAPTATAAPGPQPALGTAGPPQGAAGGASPQGPQPGLTAPAAQRTGPMGLPDVTFGPDGKPDPQAQAAFLSALPPNLADLVKKAANYQLTPSQMFTLRSGNDRAMFDAVMAKYDPTYDATLYPARAAYNKNITSGPISVNVTQASTAIAHLSQLAENAAKLNNSNFPAWNMVANTAKNETGQPEVNNFDVNAKAATDELAKFFKGTGATDVGSIDSWRSSLDHNASQPQTMGAIDTAIGLLKSRMDVLEQQYETTMGHPPPGGYSTFMRPEAQQALIKLGYDPVTMEKGNSAPAAPGAPGAPNTTSTGVQWSFSP